MTDKAKIISALVDKFLSWPLPKDFSPDGGITFARTVNGEERKGPWWPIGTNLFTAEQARQMLEYLLADQLTALCAEEAGVQEPVAWVNQDWDTFNTIGLFPGCDNPIPLYAAPPSAQSLIDAAREEAANVCLKLDVQRTRSNVPHYRLAEAARAIRALIGQPLNEAKGG